MRKISVAFVLGTRPEIVKLAPLIFALKEEDAFVPWVVHTGQHQEMADSFFEVFGIVPRYDLGVMTEHQSLFYLTSRIMEGLEKVFEGDRPDMVIVQGDTTSALCGALAAFYARIPCAHVEAGLRTFQKYSPFPEEMNRVLLGRLADLHFVPTPRALENLLREGIPRERIFVSGNTVVDALLHILHRNPSFSHPLLLEETREGKVVTVTAHRRENWGKGIEEVTLALKDIVALHKEARVFFPLHPNPVVRETVRAKLSGIPRVFLLDSLPYPDFVRLLSQSSVVISDSGGVQEEATALGIPVVVTRECTERPEVLECGIGTLTGCQREAIVERVLTLLKEEGPYKRRFVFGDGKAAERIAKVLLCFFGFSSSEVEEFVPC
ncbi:MAG: non-hydrolyzing UDP-N-acetylglucosamine 2-epimerase [Candidatus Caldatribacteriaceae bacterium]